MKRSSTLKADYLEVCFTGTFDQRELQSQVSAILYDCFFLNLSKAIIDFSRIDGEMLATHEVMFAVKVRLEFRKTLMLARKPLALAIVFKNGGAMREPAAKFMTRDGLNVFITGDSRKATEWLVSTDPLSPPPR